MRGRGGITTPTKFEVAAVEREAHCVQPHPGGMVVLVARRKRCLDEHTEHSLLQTQVAVRFPLQIRVAVRCPLQTQAAVHCPHQTQAAAEAGVHLWARADMMKEDDRPGLDTREVEMTAVVVAEARASRCSHDEWCHRRYLGRGHVDAGLAALAVRADTWPAAVDT